MSVDILWFLQKALYDKLKASAGLTALLSGGADGIYDHVPQTAQAPYVAFGDMRLQPFDTQEFSSCEVVAEIHAFSRYNGNKDIQKIAMQIHMALHNQSLTISGYKIVLLQSLDLQLFTEADGETKHSLQKFRMIIEAV
jgi:hypothetical protein